MRLRAMKQVPAGQIVAKVEIKFPDDCDLKTRQGFLTELYAELFAKLEEDG